MKKVLFLAAALVVAFAFTSCKKNCTCTEKNTNYSQKIKTDSEFKTCEDIEDYMNDLAEGLGQDWNCK